MLPNLTTANTEQIRLFIGSPLSRTSANEARDGLLSLYARHGQIDATLPWRLKWVEPENWHLTWLFLGNTPIGEIPALQNALEVALKDWPSLEAIIEKPIFWPSSRKASTLVCPIRVPGKDTDGQEDIVADTAEIIRQAVRPGIKPDKPFKPHLTLARIKTQKPAQGTNAAEASQGKQPRTASKQSVSNLEPITTFGVESLDGLLSDYWRDFSWRIDHIALIQSTLTPGGAIYKPLASIPLK